MHSPCYRLLETIDHLTRNVTYMYFDLVRYNFQRPKRETRLQHIHILWSVSLPDKSSDKPEKMLRNDFFSMVNVVNTD